MGILKTINRHFDAEQPNSLVSYNRAINVLSRDNEFIEEVLNCFAVTPEIRKHPLTIGNVSPLFADIQSLDEQDWKWVVICPRRIRCDGRVCAVDHRHGLCDGERRHHGERHLRGGRAGRPPRALRGVCTD